MHFDSIKEKQQDLLEVLFKKANGDPSSVVTSSSSPEGNSNTSITMGGNTGLPAVAPAGTAGTPGSPVTIDTSSSPATATTGTSGGSTPPTDGGQRPVSTGFNPSGYQFGGGIVQKPKGALASERMSPMSEYKNPQTKTQSQTPWIDSLLNTLSENKFAVGGGLGGALLGALAGGENKLLWSLLLGGLGAGAGYMFDRD